MSLFTSINLSELPPPTLVEESDFDTIVETVKTELMNIAPDFNLNGLAESDPVYKLLEVISHRELRLRRHINTTAAGVMLATAADSNLDNLTVLVGVKREQIDPGDPDASPPIAASYENDQRLRSRAQLALEGFSTAGPKGAYISHALSADVRVKDVSVYSLAPGVVEVRVLSTEQDGRASPDLLQKVRAALDASKVRPITDRVNVASATILGYTVNATLILFPGFDAGQVLAAAQTAAEAHITKRHGLGVDITRAGLFAALHQPGVRNVVLTDPAVDILVDQGSTAAGGIGTIDSVEYPAAVPRHLATQVVFYDDDDSADAGEIAGEVIITPAAEQFDITHYQLYWGANNSQKLPCGSRVYSFSGDSIPLDHQNIEDLVVTSEDGITIYVQDADYSIDDLSGTITSLNEALDNGVVVRVSYQLTPIASLEKSDGAISHTIAPHTHIPQDATHLLVFTKNEFGEMVEGIGTLIFDRRTPTETAAGMVFSDTDLEVQKIAGTVTINPATDESSLTHYALYWGQSATEKLADASIIALPAKTGDDLHYSFDTGTAIPEGASHLLVYTQHKGSEMATGIGLAIVDNYPSTHKATRLALADTDSVAGQLKGYVDIGKALDETDITHYALYWGESGSQKLSDETQALIALLAKTGSQLSYSFAAATQIPADASHLLVYTQRLGSEMASGISLAIVDVGTPIYTASSLGFINLSSDVGQLQGDVLIGKAADEGYVTHYALYWGKSSSEKIDDYTVVNELNQTVTLTAFIDLLAKTGADLQYSFDAATEIPNGATHLLVYTQHNGIEMDTDEEIVATPID